MNARMTKTGLEELKSELQERIEEKRPKLREIIEDMRDKGDVSENEGYTLSLEEYESNERRIAELESLIDKAQVVNAGNSGKVGLGSVVTLKSDGGEQVYTIVGQSEANPIENKISEETPLGQALKGKKAGEKVVVQLPRGETTYEIVEVK